MLSYADLQCTNPRNVILLLQDAILSAWKASPSSVDGAHISTLSHSLELLSEVAFDFAEGRKGYFGDTGNAFRISLLLQMEATKRLTPEERLTVLSAIDFFRKRLAVSCRKDVKRERRCLAGSQKHGRKGSAKDRTNTAFNTAKA